MTFNQQELAFSQVQKAPTSKKAAWQKNTRIPEQRSKPLAFREAHMHPCIRPPGLENAGKGSRCERLHGTQARRALRGSGSTGRDHERQAPVVSSCSFPKPACHLAQHLVAAPSSCRLGASRADFQQDSGILGFWVLIMTGLEGKSELSVTALAPLVSPEALGVARGFTYVCLGFRERGF